MCDEVYCRVLLGTAMTSRASEILKEFFYYVGIKLRNSVKMRGIPLITEFRKIGNPPGLFFDGIMDTIRVALCTVVYTVSLCDFF